MKKSINKILIVAIIVFLVIMLAPVKSHAGLQANKGGASKLRTSASDFFSLIRAMESTDGTLAVDNTYGIDCHMVKSTEWGTAEMMALSNYGVRPTDGTDNSTTNNESGVYQMAGGLKEYTSSYGRDGTNYYSYWTNIYNANGKYKDIYENYTSSINGDGLILWADGLRGWGDASNDTVMTRGGPAANSSRMFLKYYGSNGCSSSDCGSRAIVVCGTGL